MDLAQIWQARDKASQLMVCARLLNSIFSHKSGSGRKWALHVSLAEVVDEETIRVTARCVSRAVLKLA